MKYLFAGNQTEQRFTLLLSLTSITSEKIIDGLRYHLVKGHPLEQAALLAEVKKNNLSRAVDTLNDAAEIVETIKEIDGVK